MPWQINNNLMTVGYWAFFFNPRFPWTLFLFRLVRFVHIGISTSVKAGKSQSDSCNIPESLKAITANLEKRLEEVNAMLYDLKEANNKTVESYTRVVSESGSSNKKDYGIRKRKFKNKKHTERRKKTRKDIGARTTESNRK